MRLTRFWCAFLISILLVSGARAQSTGGTINALQGSLTGGPGTSIAVSNVLPGGATYMNSWSSGAAQANNPVLTSAVGRTVYITGFQITGGGANTGSLGVATVSGVVSGPLTYYFGIQTGAGSGMFPLIVTFNPPMPASGTNTNITVSVPSFGVGNTGASVTVQGYIQ